MEKVPLTSLLPRYFVQGMLFSLLNLGPAVGWSLITAAFASLTGIAGLVVGVVLLFFLMAAINIVLTGSLWDLSVRDGFGGLFVHGITLFLILLIVSIPALILNNLFPSLAVRLAMLILYSLIDGYVAVNVASYWESDLGS